MSQGGLTQSLLRYCNQAAARHWLPATGGNLSVRIAADRCLITASGVDKASLTENDLVTVDLQGKVVAGPKPSAETLVHCALYGSDPAIQAVFHTHSVAATVLSRKVEGDTLWLEGFEMQKAIRGVTDHLAPLGIACFDNTQDMPALAEQIRSRYQAKPFVGGLLLKGHGLYAFGQSPEEAWRHLEGLEFLLQCEWELRR
ncbi:methylthioribulose 1-phosphate dehydratase [Gallaecimonas kandeliae]|uniref:methylthioribulose 1-phosphate dehydratase n=1 Tax=Gallaecimonas kandeliae TaxID=3029055 RepID=UPI0026486B44|nr:methylthioribulose 1-phosphate dehydratase [Gallaecimonas kandeliae]WKE64138.1 methylthioribulose 1-phosphate dehydratase [Gallaecimonas kandeliae]